MGQLRRSQLASDCVLICCQHAPARSLGNLPSGGLMLMPSWWNGLIGAKLQGSGSASGLAVMAVGFVAAGFVAGGRAKGAVAAGAGSGSVASLPDGDWL